MRPLPESQQAFYRTSLAFVLLLVLPFSFRLLFAQSKSNPGDFATLSAQANAARDSSRPDEAVSLYKKALVSNPTWAEGWFYLGTLEYDRNNYAAAAHAFRQVLPLAPKEGSAHALLGLCEYELGQYDNALKHIEEARALGVANNPQFRHVILYHEGLLYLRNRKFEAARESFAQLCRDDSSNRDTLMAMGMVALRIAGTPPTADASSDAAVIPRIGHAACLAAAQQYDQARPEFAALVAARPGYPNIHYAYGRFLAEVNEIPLAVEQFRLEIRNNPKDVNSRLEIAATEYKVDSAAGIPYVEEVIRMAPQVAFAHYLLGLLYLDTGEFQKAILELELAAKAFPKDPEVYFALSSALTRAGRKQDGQKARETFERLKKETNANAKATY